VNIREYFTRHLERLRDEPTDDLLSDFPKFEGDRDVLSKPGAACIPQSDDHGGNGRTTELLGNAFYWLWQHSDRHAWLREDLRRIPDWVEETLRYDNSTRAPMRPIRESVRISALVVVCTSAWERNSPNSGPGFCSKSDGVVFPIMRSSRLASSEFIR